MSTIQLGGRELGAYTEWELYVRGEARRLGLGLRDYGKLMTLHRQEAQARWEAEHPVEVAAYLESW